MWLKGKFQPNLTMVLITLVSEEFDTRNNYSPKIWFAGVANVTSETTRQLAGWWFWTHSIGICERRQVRKRTLFWNKDSRREVPYCSPYLWTCKLRHWLRRKDNLCDLSQLWIETFLLWQSSGTWARCSRGCYIRNSSISARHFSSES